VRVDIEHEPLARELHPELAGALEQLGDRWSLLVVDALTEGPMRFTDLRRELPGIASNVLTERLRRLESAGVLSGETYSSRPPRTQYRLSPAGQGLRAVIAAFVQWANPGGAQPGPVHGRCGTVMESRWYCPHCDEVAEMEASPEPEDDVFFT
jgi:DNA-binding HxlR family transcriptional regulator